MNGRQVSETVPVAYEDPRIKGLCYEFKNPLEVTKHGYKCPVCRQVIGACHDAALLVNALLLWQDPDPNKTQPPIPSEASGFDIID
jgi:hypothetical protein